MLVNITAGIFCLCGADSIKAGMSEVLNKLRTRTGVEEGRQMRMTSTD